MKVKWKKFFNFPNFNLNLKERNDENFRYIWLIALVKYHLMENMNLKLF